LRVIQQALSNRREPGISGEFRKSPMKWVFESRGGSFPVGVLFGASVDVNIARGVYVEW